MHSRRINIRYARIGDGRVIDLVRPLDCGEGARVSSREGSHVRKAPGKIDRPATGNQGIEPNSGGGNSIIRCRCYLIAVVSGRLVADRLDAEILQSRDYVLRLIVIRGTWITEMSIDSDRLHKGRNAVGHRSWCRTRTYGKQLVRSRSYQHQ